MALIDRVQDVGQVINYMEDKISELCSQIEELRVGLALEAITVVE